MYYNVLFFWNSEKRKKEITYDGKSLACLSTVKSVPQVRVYTVGTYRFTTCTVPCTSDYACYYYNCIIINLEAAIIQRVLYTPGRRRAPVITDVLEYVRNTRIQTRWWKNSFVVPVSVCLSLPPLPCSRACPRPLTVN